MTANPWDKFFWNDWENDPALKLCSLSAQGLWMRMLCICAKAEPKGYLLVAGRPLSPTDLASLVGKPEGEVETLLRELSVQGVLSLDRKERIYNRRMVRDAARSRKASENGKLGGNPSLGKEREKRQSLNPPLNPEVKPHKPEARYSEAKASGAVAPPTEFEEDDRTKLFGPGRQWLEKQTGQSTKQVRTLIGRWLKLVGDDATAVLAIVRRAKDLNIAEPIAWIEAALRGSIAPAAHRDDGVTDRHGHRIDWDARAIFFAKSGMWLEEWGDPKRSIPAEYRSKFSKLMEAA